MSEETELAPTQPAAAADPTKAPSAAAVETTQPVAVDTAKLASHLIKELGGGEEVSTEEIPVPKIEDEGAEVRFKLVYNKQNYDITMGENRTVRELKDHIETLTKLPRPMQKLMFKGLVKDETKTLKDLKLAKNSKMMLVGTMMSDIVAVNTKPSTSEIAESTGAASSKREPLCKQKLHVKVLEKGKPEDAMPGMKGVKHSLPNTPINGMVNKAGGKVRLTFKLEEDSLWIGTKARTEKVNMSSIRTVVSEPIEDSPEYHIMGIQLGPTELSMYWVYWVPAQYVDAVKDAILGKWQPFF